MTAFAVLLVTLCTFASAQKDPHWLENRNTIVHLFEWKWKDIAEECERFLQHHGYAGVQISPPSENIIVPKRPWWERYQPISYKLATRSGTESDFLEMTKRCNNVGIRIYADVVFNHMAANPVTPEAVGTGGSKADPVRLNYPDVPYSSSDFHKPCAINNYNDSFNVRNCMLEGLKDLDQSSNYVRQKILEFLNKLVDLGVAGFRVDAAKHMSPPDLEYIFNNVKNLNVDFKFPVNARPFIYQEVIDLGGEAISKYSYTHMGAVTEFKHSADIGNVFRGRNKLAGLRNWGTDWGFLHSGDALIFIDNHDNQRGHGAGGESILTYKNEKLYKMATAFMLAYPYGITRIMSSYDFRDTNQGPPQNEQEQIASPTINSDGTCGNGWICEHRWRQIHNMVFFKNVVKGTDVNSWWSNEDQQIAFCRGLKGFVAFTNGGDLKKTLQTCLPPGNYCDVISGNLIENKTSCTGKSVKVGSDGKGFIEINSLEKDGVVVIHVESKVKDLQL